MRDWKGVIAVGLILTVGTWVFSFLLGFLFGSFGWRDPPNEFFIGLGLLLVTGVLTLIVGVLGWAFSYLTKGRD